MNWFVDHGPTKIARAHPGILVACLALAACAASAPPETPRAAAAIDAVLAEDTALGGVRNHASESMPLAEAIRAYVKGLDEIDFGECPSDFATAFQRHRDAWWDSIEYFEHYSGMRGELHDLFDAIRELGDDARIRMEDIEKSIWGTWSEVEAAVARHGGKSD